MELTEETISSARAEMASNRKIHAVSVIYRPRVRRIVVTLNTGIEIAIPPDLVEGLRGARPADLAQVELSPSGLGMHWPALDANVYVPSLLQGITGSKQWMAQQLGAHGGRSRSTAKAEAARANGAKGGRPRKSANGH